MNNIALILNPSITFKRYLPKKWMFSLRTFWFLGAGLLITTLIFYIFQINEITKLSYLMGSYEKRISSFSQDNGSLEARLSKTNSLENIEALVNNLNFEPVGKVNYIRILDDTIVTKQ